MDGDRGLQVPYVSFAHSLPSREQELLLHRRLVDREALASSDLASTYLDHLIDWLLLATVPSPTISAVTPPARPFSP